MSMNSDQTDHESAHGDHQDTQRQPLLPQDIQDSSSDDDAGANSSGYTRRKAKIHRYTYFFVLFSISRKFVVFLKSSNKVLENFI